MKKYLFEIISGIFLLLLSGISVYLIFFPTERKDLIVLNMTLAKQPVLQEQSEGTSIKLYLKEVHQFEFCLDEEFYTTLKKKQAFHQLKKGSFVHLLIDRDEFRAKIAKSILPSTLQRINWNQIHVVELKANNQTLLAFNTVIEMQTNTAYYILWFCGFSLLIVFSHAWLNTNYKS
jgi:hypothetical protein